MGAADVGGASVTTDHQARHVSASARPWLFLGLTLALTWVLWFAAAAAGGSIPPWGVTALHYAGGLVPLAVALALSFLLHDRAFRRDYWRRLIDFRRIPIGWYAVILLYTPLKSGIAALVDTLQGAPGSGRKR